MTANYRSIERALIALVPRQISDYLGIRIYRCRDKTWRINGGDATSLLVAIDTLAEKVRQLPEPDQPMWDGSHAEVDT